MDDSTYEAAHIMWSQQLIALSYALAIGSCGLWYLTRSGKRSPQEVAALLTSDLEDRTSDKASAVLLLQGADAQAGLLTPKEAQIFRLRNHRLTVLVPIALVAARALIAPAQLSTLITLLVASLALTYLITRRTYSWRKARFQREIEFFLPVVMERLVMAVEAGLDVIPALGAVVEQANSSSANDPVTRLLGIVHRLTEQGCGLDQSLHVITNIVDCAALRHAFVHLGLAHREGGELVAPLRELSDSTQLFYQETIEEEIAKLPVKATAPLVCTFAGLILFFITSPVVQVMKIATEAMPK